MRIGKFLPVVVVALSACEVTADETVSTRFLSSASVDLLATCIAQDFDGAFPRFFPSEKTPARRVFRTYNGISVAIEDKAEGRRITVSSQQALTANQAHYIRQCISMAEAS